MQIENNARQPQRLSKISQYFTVVLSRDQYLFGQDLYTHDITELIKPNTRINVEKACQLITQTVYLVYAAHRQKKRLDIDCSKDLVVNRLEIDNSSPIGITVLMTYGLSSDGGPITCRAQISRLLGSILPYLAQANGGQLPPILHAFQENFSLISTLNIGSDYDLIFLLEETALFRNHATVLRLMNLMFMNLLKNDQEAMRNFEEQAIRQKYLVAEYKEFKQNKQNEKATAKIVQINKLIKNFFSESMKSISNYKCNIINDASPNQVKFQIKIKEKPMGFSQLLKSKYSTQIATSEYKPSQLTYLVQYNGQRNNLSVRLTTELKLLNQTQDLYLYQCNLMTYNFEGICIEMLEQPVQNQQVKSIKYLIFKASEQSIQKQTVFVRIVNLIDRVMVVFRMIQPQLCHIITRNLQVSEDITNSIEHYLRLHDECLNTVFSEIIKS